MRLRIEDLATRTGISTRNIRAYQTGGLLPPPEMEGRTGWYGEDHLQRLEMIADLQDRGFSLAAIKETLDAWASGGNLGHLVGLRQVLRQPEVQPEPETVTSDRLFEMFPEAQQDPALVLRAIDEGLVVPDGEGDFTAPSALLLTAGHELVQLGIPLGEILDAVHDVKDLAQQIADRFVALAAPHAVDRVGGGVVDQVDGPALDELATAIGRLRPIAVEVVRPWLATALETSINAEVTRLLRDQSDDHPQRPTPTADEGTP